MLMNTQKQNFSIGYCVEYAFDMVPWRWLGLYQGGQGRVQTSSFAIKVSVAVAVMTEV